VRRWNNVECGRQTVVYTTCVTAAAMTDGELGDCVRSVEMTEHRCSELLMPSADDQRAIVASLESDVTQQGCQYVYSVSRAWYDRWRAYVGLDETARGRSDLEDGDGHSHETTIDENTPAAAAAASTAVSCRREASDGEVCSRRDGGIEAETTNIKSAAVPPAPGPLEMDLGDDDNVSVDEKVCMSCS